MYNRSCNNFFQIMFRMHWKLLKTKVNNKHLVSLVNTINIFCILMCIAQSSKQVRIDLIKVVGIWKTLDQVPDLQNEISRSYLSIKQNVTSFGIPKGKLWRSIKFLAQKSAEFPSNALRRWKSRKLQKIHIILKIFEIP